MLTGDALSSTKHRYCISKYYMKSCNSSSGMTFPLPPDRAVKPCPNTGCWRKIRQHLQCQNVLTSSPQLFLSKAILTPEDILTGENSGGSHTSQLCPRWVKLSSHRSYKLKSHETINTDGVSATLPNHVHVHIFQHSNNFPPTWNVSGYHPVLSFEVYENKHKFFCFLAQKVLNQPLSENQPDEKVLKGSFLICLLCSLTN